MKNTTKSLATSLGLQTTAPMNTTQSKRHLKIAVTLGAESKTTEPKYTWFFIYLSLSQAVGFLVHTILHGATQFRYRTGSNVGLFRH